MNIKTTDEILKEYKSKKELAYFNKANTFNENDKKTAQALIDYLNKEWTEVSEKDTIIKRAEELLKKSEKVCEDLRIIFNFKK